jgi:site-specific DNA-methyltransferase (adenine-specific)
MLDLINADCIEGLRNLEAGSVDVVVTSPPYNLGIDYSTYSDKKTREDYLQWMRDVFLECKRVLHDKGHLFLNVGYSNVDPWVNMDVAQTLRQDWVLQNNICWVKSIHVGDKTTGHFKPINSKRYINPTWESLFHFTKDGNVEIDKLGVGVPFEVKSNIARRGHAQDLRDRGNSWFIPYPHIKRKWVKGNHPAIFPPDLVKFCLKTSGIEKGVLCDPFVGTGTSAWVAQEMGWDFIGFDIDEEYLNFARERLNNVLAF